MTLSHGRPYLAIPGPSVVPDRVLQAMHQPAPNIYGGALADTVRSIITDLKTVVRTQHQATIYIANGHGVWEAALANVLSRGDKVLVLATGLFGLGWANMAERLGAEVEILDYGNRSDIDLAQAEAVLRADTEGRIKAVMAVHVDTSTSVRNDIPALRAVMDRTGHDALLMVDCIASLGVERFEMDAWGVDVAVAASQKGIMVPPGLGFVFFNDKADAAREKVDLVSYYWDWRPRAQPEDFYQYFAGTAPTHHIFALREALDMLVHEEGVEAAWARHAKLAQAVWAAFDIWGARGPAELNIADADKRSHAVTAVRIGAPEGTALRDWVSEKAGVTLGIGIGMAPPGDPAWHGFFRIGHMGHVNAHMLLGVLGVIEAGMDALGIEHGDGALSAAARVVASA
ncbi:pyridoxal-phosphate-dependent aminotransferase family protein [Profundibacter amoris]|uniref:Alanine--glyoxylate aminotransferase family protein n=1 Tax=Profundibacter amoris TaxID=2171755 RepID=A0A347UE77_9RHOB|nr:aminotransferase class V-fold PLP-dependent enzyme [Profundibacter amoris]AXX97155.1 alanine--glyoxylate aminotransferase family protein [Profundibacter amoris]